MSEPTSRPSGASTEPPSEDDVAAYAASLVTAEGTSEEHARARALGAAYLAGRRAGAASTEATERPDLEAALDELAEAFPVDEVSDAPWVAERGSIVWMVREGAGGPQIGNFILEADARWVADARNRAALTGATSPSEPSREDAVELTDGLDRPSGVYMCLACGSSVTPDPFNDGGGVDFGKREVYPIGSRTRCECPCHRNAGAAPEEERS